MNLRRRNHPFTRRAAIVLAALLVLGACGGGDDDVAGDAGDDDDAGATAETGADNGRTPWNDADFERLIATEIDGYTVTNTRISEFGNATVAYLENEPSTTTNLSALVTFQDCDPFVCGDFAAEVDAERRENALSLLPRIHIDNPDLVEEMGPVVLAGQQALGIYFRSFVEDDGPSTALTYRAFTHDGVNLLTVQVSPDFFSAGGLADTPEELAARMSPAAAEAVAEEIIAAFAAELG